ncbi:MAG TPA: hypothetical protein VJV79_24385 [Polyangiaceae bacterium]|nr:hypothetical protein [Polyangiaceae bacterium]
MKLNLAALILAALGSCARGEPPTPGATHPATAIASSPPSGPQPRATASGPAAAAPAAPQPSSAESSAPTATSDTLPEVNVSNREGLRGLLAALKEVERVELLRWDRRAKPEPLSTADKTRLLQLIQGGRITDTRTLAHPPWPAALLFHTQKQGTYAATLVGRSSLRLDAGRADGHFEGAAARWNSAPPPEMVLSDEGNWLWTYFEAHLGATREKEYLTPKAPDYLELPQKPH